jgi:hypothetical protein
MPSKRLPLSSNWRQNVPRGIEGLAEAGEIQQSTCLLQSCLAAFATLGLPVFLGEVVCLEKTIERLETDLELMRHRAKLWSVGDVEGSTGIDINRSHVPDAARRRRTQPP